MGLTLTLTLLMSPTSRHSSVLTQDSKTPCPPALQAQMLLDCPMTCLWCATDPWGETLNVAPGGVCEDAYKITSVYCAQTWLVRVR
jgi:hypothetical protein